MTDDKILDTAYEAMVNGDYQEAVRLFTPFADNDSAFALINLGWMHAVGHIGVANKDLARKFYERAINLGSADGYLHMGWLLMAEDKFAEARAMFEKGRELGNDECDDALSHLPTKELEFRAFDAIENKDYRKALQLLEPHQENGSDYVLITLGWLYETGRAGITKRDLACSFYRRAAANGDIDAHYRIGTLELDQGDEKAARAAFGGGAAIEHLPAMSKLGQMMVEGVGGPLDVEQGMKLLHSAAQQGHFMSRARLVRIESKQTKSIFRKIALRFKLLVIAKDAVKESFRDRHSPNLYEFR